MKEFIISFSNNESFIFHTHSITQKLIKDQNLKGSRVIGFRCSSNNSSDFKRLQHSVEVHQS